MTEYILALIGMSTVISVICMVAPKKSQKYTRLVCTLCLLCVILRPLPSILNSELFLPVDIDGEVSDDLEEFYVEIYNNTIREANGERIADGLKNMMVKDLSLPIESFEVTVDIEESDGNIVVKRTTVLLYSGAVSYDPHAIVSYLEKMLDCSCEIVYYND